MPTTDLVSGGSGFAGGGVGDGQRTSVTGTITSGASPVFTPVSNIFTSGDIGKAIYLVTTGWSYPTDLTAITITAYNAGTGAVTLSGTNSTAKTSVVMDVLWGTNNNTALIAFQTWAQGQSGQVILTIPAGRFCTNTNGFVAPNANIPNLKWVGAGAGSTFISQLVASEMRWGGLTQAVKQKGMTDAAGNSARIQTAAAGATTVSLVDPTTYGARLTAGVGRHCLIAGYDLQSTGSGLFGYPPNQNFYEYNKIVSYSGGVVTLQNPLTQVYKSTWPFWSSGDANHCDQGGSATIWVLDTDYDQTIEFNDLTFDNPYHQNAVLSRDVILRRVAHIGPGTYPTQCNTFLADTCTYTQTLEIDKLVNQVDFVDCTLGNMFFQSASPNVLTITGGTMEQSSGTPKKFTYTGVTFVNTAKFQAGASAYGGTTSGTVTNCPGIASFIRGGGSSTDIGSDASTFYDFNAGLMRFLKSTNDGSSGRQNPTRLFSPGSWVTFDDKYIDQVVDVTEDGTYCYIQFKNTTNWPFTPMVQFRSHPCPDFTMRNCIGTAYELEDWNQAPARIPLYSYTKRTHVADATAATAWSINRRPFLIGKLKTAKFTAGPLFTGGSALTWQYSQFTDKWLPFKQSDYTTTPVNVVVNAKIAGERNIVNGGSPTGAQSGDTLTDLTTPGSVWCAGTSTGSPVFSANVSNGDTPTILFEIATDQGIPSPLSVTPANIIPFRFRLHG